MRRATGVTSRHSRAEAFVRDRGPVHEDLPGSAGGTLHAPFPTHEVSDVELDMAGTGTGFILAATTLTGRAAETGIFEAGAWFGIIGVLAILFLGVTTLDTLKL